MLNLIKPNPCLLGSICLRLAGTSSYVYNLFTTFRFCSELVRIHILPVIILGACACPEANLVCCSTPFAKSLHSGFAQRIHVSHEAQGSIQIGRHLSPSAERESHEAECAQRVRHEQLFCCTKMPWMRTSLKRPRLQAGEVNRISFPKRGHQCSGSLVFRWKGQRLVCCLLNCRVIWTRCGLLLPFDGRRCRSVADVLAW